MTPEDRGDQMPASVLSMIVDGLREVKESVSRLSIDMNTALAKLPDIYVPRKELEHRLDEHTIDIGELRSQMVQKKSKHDADVQHLHDRMDEAESQRRLERRWMFGAVVSVVSLLLTTTAIILSQLN